MTRIISTFDAITLVDQTGRRSIVVPPSRGVHRACSMCRTCHCKDCAAWWLAHGGRR